MVHLVIEPAESSDSGESLWSAFDRKLEEALDKVETAASVRLKGSMGCGMVLVRWLDWWSNRYRENGKTLIIIPHETYQKQCIELSHPAMKLVYVMSMDEVDDLVAGLSKSNPESLRVSEKEPADFQVKPNQYNDVSGNNTTDNNIDEKSKILQSSDIKKAHNSGRKKSYTRESNTEDRQEGVVDCKCEMGYRNGISKIVKHGVVIEIAGEYRCNSCGMTRIYCKGDIVDKCENRECAGLDTGFTLIYDLF